MRISLACRGCSLLLALFFSLILTPVYAAEDFTLIYSGNLDGELEPCGCTEQGDLGGILRRATLLDRLRQENPNLIALSAGGLLSAVGSTDQIKSAYILEGFVSLGYDVIGVQWGDLSYGPEFMRSRDLPWVSSNWLDEDVASQGQIRRQAWVFTFFSWLDPDSSPLRGMQGEHRLAGEDNQALSRALAEAKQRGAITILSSTLTAEAMAPLVDLGNVDIYLEEAGYEVYAEPRQVASTLVLKPGSRGMRLGRLDFRLVNNRIAQWDHQVLDMPDTIPDSARLAGWYDAYNAEVKAAYLQQVEIRKMQQTGESPYIGEAACKNCHSDKYEIWQQTEHAGAFAKLEDVNKAFDPACIGCHTVGFEKPGGYVDLRLTGHLANVQCESCHGPGRDHVQSTGQKPVANHLWSPRQMCGQCHVQKHSPGFDFDSYWPRIAH